MTDHQSERRCTCTSSLENVAQTAPWKQKREADALLVFALKSLLHAWNGNVLLGFLIYLPLDNFPLWNCKAPMSFALKAGALQKTKSGTCLSPPPCHCCCTIHLEDALTLWSSFGCLRCQSQCQESLVQEASPSKFPLLLYGLSSVAAAGGSSGHPLCTEPLAGAAGKVLAGWLPPWALLLLLGKTKFK